MITKRAGLLAVVALIGAVAGSACSTHPNIEFATSPPVTPNGTPLVPQVVSVTAGYATIGASWLPDPSSQSVIDYRVFVATTAWSTWSPGLRGAVVSTAACCSAVITGLQNETDYYVGVAAHNASGQSASSIPTRIRPPGWSGTQTFCASNAYVFSSGLVVDSNGNLYSTGSLTGSIPGAIGTGAYLSKVDSTGRLVWLKAVTLNPFHQGDGIARVPDGTFAIAGSTGDGGYPGFGGGSGSSKYGVAKLTADGATVWADVRGATTTEDDYAYGVAVDSSGDVFAVGTTNANLDGQTNHGGTDTFVAKFDRDGNWIWTKLIGTTGNETGRAIAIDDANDVYVVGTTTGTLDGNANASGNAAFVEKLDLAGNALWSPASRLFASVDPHSATVDDLGNIYVGGYDGGILVMSVSPTGTLRWSKVLQTTPSVGQYDYAFATRFADGAVYCSGITNGDFGGGVDAFAASLDPASGNLRWSSLAYAGPLSDYATGIDVDTDAEVYVSGLAGWGGHAQLFISKFNPDGTIVQQ